MSPRRNEIYWAEISFTDSAEKKRRPVIILSGNKYNEKEPDVITCSVTTSSTHPYFLQISKKDLVKGILFSESGARVDTITRINKNKLGPRMDKITDEFHGKLVEKIVELIG